MGCLAQNCQGQLFFPVHHCSIHFSIHHSFSYMMCGIVVCWKSAPLSKCWSANLKLRTCFFFSNRVLHGERAYRPWRGSALLIVFFKTAVKSFRRNQWCQLKQAPVHCITINSLSSLKCGSKPQCWRSRHWPQVNVWILFQPHAFLFKLQVTTGQNDKQYHGCCH